MPPYTRPMTSWAKARLRREVSRAMRTTLLFTLLACLNAKPAPLWAGDLKTLKMQTTVFVCNGNVAFTPIQNTTGATVYLRKAQLWFGMDVGKTADLSGEILASVSSRRDTLALAFPQHRYAQPNSLTQVGTPLGTDHIRLLTGQSLDVKYSCSPVTPGPFNAAVHAIVWYVMDPTAIP